MTQHNSLNVKLSNSQLNKLKSAIKNETLIKNVIKPLAKSVLIPLGLTATAAADARTHKKIIGSGHSSSSAPRTTTLIISIDEVKEIIEIVKSLEDSGLLFKGVSETIQNEAKGQKGGFLSMLLGTLGASLLGNILTGKGINRAGKGIGRAGYGNKKGQKTTKRQDHKNKWDF